MIDIDVRVSDVDLTHWDVSHVSNTNKALISLNYQTLLLAKVALLLMARQWGIVA
jgi:hypothetical protein